MTPTQRTLKRLRDDGYIAEVVERYNYFARKRKDFLNCIDIIAIRQSEILGVQATSRSNVSARVKKASAEPMLTQWKDAGGKFEVWGWGKVGKRGTRKKWEVRKVEL